MNLPTRFKIAMAGVVTIAASITLSAPVAATEKSDLEATGSGAAQRAAPTTVDSKGGYKACKNGKKIRVRVEYNALSKGPGGGQKVLARIYRSPSKSSKGDVNRYMPQGRGEYNNTVFVESNISVGYWNVRSTPDPKIVNQFTYARCVS